jgi:F0F1-type ATP synthase delta subunit
VDKKKKITLHQSSRSILEELQRAVPNKTKEHVLESRGHHIISAANNFLDVLTENYTEEEAEQITRRFLSAIRGGDPKRFIRQIRKIREAKEENNGNDKI